MADVNSSIDYEDKIISDEVRRKMDAAVKKAEAEGIEIESEYYTGSDLDKMKEFARLNDAGVITGDFADFGRGVNVPRTPTLFNLFAMEEELSHNREPYGPDINEGKFKANPARELKHVKSMYDEEKRAKKEALQKTGGLLPKGQRTVELTKNTYAKMFNDAINKYVEKTGDIETKKVFLNDYPELKNVKKVIYPEKEVPFNEGGAVPMKEQMEMFEDGGLMEEGGTTDPESGNDVPVGSTQEEVRDDIPAQLSEGEFVLPADVVRYHGLEKIMALRDEAKMGLSRMDAMGQMGNSEEATIPDGVPFDINDLDIEDEISDNNELEMQVGGFVQPQGFTGIQSKQPSQFQNYQPQYTPYQPVPMQQTYTPPVQQTIPTTTQQTQVPSFQSFIQPAAGMAPENREYINPETQERRIITFINNKPTTAIPLGFVPSKEYKPEQAAEATTAPTQVQTTTVRDGGGKDDTALIGGVTPAEIQQGKAEAKDRYAITGSRGLDILSLLPGGNFIKNMFDVQGPTIGAKAPEPMAFGPQQIQRTEYEKVLGTGITGYVGYEKGDLDPVTGGVFNKHGIAVDKDGGQTLGPQGTFSYASVGDFSKAIAAGNKSGWRGGLLSDEAKSNLSSVAAANYSKFEKELEAGQDKPSKDTSKPDTSKPSGSSAPTSQPDKGQGRQDGPGTAANAGGREFSSQALGDRTSGRTGFNKGGKATKKMKRGGLASKK